jgi:YesN/AraC family two-component response regulator
MEDPIRVLVVDDEPEILQMLVVLLQMEGYNAKGAEDGFVALHIFYDFKPEIIITDVEMPNMDGVDLVKKIREQDKESRVIILSGREVTARASQAQSLDISEYLLKPCHPRDLITVIKKVRAGILVRRAAVVAEAALTAQTQEERESQARFELWQKRQAELIKQAVDENKKALDAKSARVRLQKVMYGVAIVGGAALIIAALYLTRSYFKF